MKNNLLSNLPETLISQLRIIVRLADNLGISAYAVGGFVRDILLKRENLDLDIVVESDAIDFAEHLVKLIPGRIITHKKFGTATIFEENFRIDLATARKETYSYPGALPDVERGSISDDLFRRDFTINAMAISLNSANFAELRDFFNGLKDLKEKEIRILHDLSFVDDPTRILRAIRFKQRFDFNLEEKTFRLLKQALSKGMLLRVKPERIFDELKHLLKEENSVRQILSVERICGFGFIDSKIKVDLSANKFLKKAEKEICWFKDAFSKKRKLDAWLIYFIILLDKLNLATVNKIISRFNLKRGDRMRIISYKNSTVALKNLNAKRLNPSAIFKILEPLSYEVIILLKSKSGSQLVKKRILAFLKMLNGAKLQVKGEDLKEIGLSPDKNFGRLLEKALDKKIEGKLKTKEDELNYIKSISGLK